MLTLIDILWLQAQGKSSFSLSGMKTRLFGSSADPAEQREQKLKQLDDEIEECEARVRSAKEELEWVSSSPQHCSFIATSFAFV